MEISSTEIIVFSLAGFAIWCWILFELIKSGVKAGILAADKAKNTVVTYEKSTPAPDAEWTPKRKELQAQYQAGKITIEEYNTEWFKP